MQAPRTPPRSPDPPRILARVGRDANAAIVALRALGIGVFVAAAAVSALLALEFDFGVPRVLAAVVMGFLGFAAVSAGEGIAVLLWTVLGGLFRRLRFRRGLDALHAVPPEPVGRILGAFVYVAGDLLWPQSFLKHLALPVVGEVAIVLFGLMVMAVALARMEGRARAVQVALLAPPAALILAFVVWVADPGFDGYLVAASPAATPSSVSPDPASGATFAVRTLSYGSGASGRRPEYGADADLVTPAVDGSEIFGGYGGLAGSFFRWYWGFDFDALPLNGLVWSPEGPGPHPLVLIVHGNHPMSEASEPGYAYLAEHLASRGYLVAAIDQNYLNGLVFFDGEFAEMPLRAWLILQHLQQWRLWNDTPGHPFEGAVDLERVVLVGHSRGGEAVAWAAHLNGHAMEPVSRVSRPDDFGFGIRGVVAIAPSDAYEGPAGRKPAHMQADYLLLAGGHDADTFMLYGQAQYNRAVVDDDPERFKALAYLHQANHGQFNGVWGGRDRGLYNSLLLNREPLLAEVAQQQAARGWVTSFLEAALRDEPADRAPFRNPATGSDWPTTGIVVTQIQEGSSIVVEDFEGQVERNVGAPGSDGAQATEALLQRDGRREQGNRALRLTWEAGTEPVYELGLSAENVAAWSLTPDHALTFALASVPGATPPKEVVVEVTSIGGGHARLELVDGAPPVTSLPAHLVKASWLYGLNGFPGAIRPEEVVLQTFTVPLAAFAEADPRFEPAMLSTIRFTFAGEAAGAVYLDEIGLARPMEASRRAADFGAPPAAMQQDASADGHEIGDIGVRGR